MRFTLLAGAALALGACRSGPTLGPGQLGAEWAGGPAPGRAVVPARAALCVETGLVELIGVRGDTGIGLALFPADSAEVRPQSFPVTPGQAGTTARPRANLALRWFDVATMQVFEGASGRVELDTVTRRGLTGTLQAGLRAVGRSDTLTLRARFRDVPLTVEPPGCGRVMRREAPGGPPA